MQFDVSYFFHRDQVAAIAIAHNRDSGPIERHQGGLRRQRPAEVYRVSAGDRGALSRCIESPEGFRRMGVVHCDRLGAKIQLTTRFVESSRMQLVSAVAWRSGPTRIRQEVSEHLVTPTRAILIGISREHGL